MNRLGSERTYLTRRAFPGRMRQEVHERTVQEEVTPRLLADIVNHEAFSDRCVAAMEVAQQQGSDAQFTVHKVPGIHAVSFGTITLTSENDSWEKKFELEFGDEEILHYLRPSSEPDDIVSGAAYPLIECHARVSFGAERGIRCIGGTGNARRHLWPTYRALGSILREQRFHEDLDVFPRGVRLLHALVGNPRPARPDAAELLIYQPSRESTGIGMRKRAYAQAIASAGYEFDGAVFERLGYEAACVHFMDVVQPVQLMAFSSSGMATLTVAEEIEERPLPKNIRYLRSVE